MHPAFAALNKFSVLKAHKAQLRLSRKIIVEDRLPQEIKRIAGVDVAYTDRVAIGAVAVLDFESLELLEQQTATTEVKLPYIPTLLSFREIPPAVACIKKLNMRPDVFLADGQGIAHPYGCGFASHLGLALGKPTIGVAKSRLIGDPITIVKQVFLVQKERVIGAVVTTKEGARPVFISIGHLISLETATEIAKQCVRNSRIPEPILHAHNIASEEKRKVQAKHKT